MKTSEVAPGFIASHLSAPLANREAAEWVANWCAEGDRPRLLDFEPAEGAPGVPGLGQGAGGWRALVDLADRAADWTESYLSAGTSTGGAVTIDALEQMGAELSADPAGPTWLCEPVIADGDWRLEILEPNA